MVHRFPTGQLGEATRLVDLRPRAVCSCSPCFELVVASLRALSSHSAVTLDESDGRQLVSMKTTRPEVGNANGKRAAIRETCRAAHA
jgi:hypothetical protein